MMTPRSFLFSRQPALQTTSEEFKHEQPRTARPPLAPLKGLSPTQTPAPVSDSRPTTPSSPVIIPSRPSSDNSKDVRRHDVRKERHQPGDWRSRDLDKLSRNSHQPDAISPSVAALLAMTSIPPQKQHYGSRGRITRGQRLTVDAILQQASVSEKEISLTLGKSPLDFLLGPPDELEEDEIPESENGDDSTTSSRTISSESVPSLEDGSLGGTPSSLGSINSPGSRSKKSYPMRRVQSISSPPNRSLSAEDHPLAIQVDLDDLDFQLIQQPREKLQANPGAQEIQRRRSAFKSNLTASLKALRSAARSLSTLTTPLMTPDDFLTRSIISPDSQIPYTDERMPPRLEDAPTPALRRYLNPTTNAPIEAHVTSPLATTSSKCTASIQMQTYKISRSNEDTTPIVISKRTRSTSSKEVPTEVTPGPVARQRDMRENSDFIRIAVMEMAMRRKGKLDDQKPGRARWALPPRIPSTKSYEIGEDGVPARWVSLVIA